MKANEMPERIYIFDYNDAMVTPLEGDIVYVREDAFIEKACEFLERAGFYQQYDPIEDNEWYDGEQLIEDFKKYMEG